MSLPATWTQFQLFDFLPIRDPHTDSNAPLFSDPSLSAITAVDSYIVLAVHNGYLKILHKQTMEAAGTFCGMGGGYKITFLAPVVKTNMVVALAERQGSPAILKLWDLQKMVALPEGILADDDAASHKFVTEVLVNEGENAFPVSCLALNDNLSCVGVGYTNGKVILVRGDLVRDRGAKQRVVYESVDPITSVHFDRFDDVVYVTTTTKVLTVLTTGRNQGKPHRVLSRGSGVDLDCADLDYRSSRLLTADPDGFNYYNHVSRARVVRFNIGKRRMRVLFKDYVLVVCPMEESTKTLTKILVLDMKNGHIAFSLTVPNSTMVHVFSSDSDVYLLSSDGVLYNLHEKPPNQQLEIVLQRQMFETAVRLAEQNNLGDSVLLRVHRAFGDHRYRSTDFDGAMDEYVKCLSLFTSIESPNTATSEDTLDDFVTAVVTAFKEVSNTANMARFLASLHELERAESDHVTLLICCYCKLNNIVELDRFIESLPSVDDTQDNFVRGSLDYNDLNYSLFVSLLKECGYYDQATRLLLKLNRPHSIVEIQLEDLASYDDCMRYIRLLPVDDLLRILIDFLAPLLDARPLEATELLISVFTGAYKPQKELLQQEKNTRASDHVLSSYSAFLGYLGGNSATETTNDDYEPTYLPPRPRLVFHCFLRHEREFVVFLEACLQSLEKYEGNSENKKDVLVTLFEMYLSMAEKDPENATEWHEKASRVLTENSSLMSHSKVLMICNAFSFSPGHAIINERSANFEENLFQLARADGRILECMSIAQKYGSAKPVLYKHMVRYMGECDEQVKQIPPKDFHVILENVHKNRLLSPLEVMNALGKNPHVTIGMVRDHLIDIFDDTQKDISNNDRLIQLYESEAATARTALKEATENPLIVNSEKCSSCEMGLEFPVIHFRCRHSYHERCLQENTYIPDADEPKCPLCVNDLRAMREIRQSNAASKELFKSQLDAASDRFKVVCDFIARGLLD